ncbi:MAG: glycosyltransferase family 2 protein [Prevotella sp.]|nr:glycosyltransferase family 2 protein [Prevotella sp.]
MEVEVSIITINYNGLEDTCALIESIPICDGMEMIVVDNASQNDEATIIAHRFPQVCVVRSDQNLGFAGGNNLGIKVAHGQYLFFINNDTVFLGPDAEKLTDINGLVARLESDSKIGVVCPKIRFYWGNHPIQYAGYTPLSPIMLRNRSIGFNEEDQGQYDVAHITPYAHGAAMIVKREVVEKVGLMPECFFLYYEELDWSMMIRRAGYQIWYDPCCTVYHKESQSTGQNSPLRTYYITRNRLLFAQRNIEIPKKYLSYCYLIVLVGTKDVLKYSLKGERELAGATIRGIIDFLKH